MIYVDFWAKTVLFWEVFQAKFVCCALAIVYRIIYYITLGWAVYWYLIVSRYCIDTVPVYTCRFVVPETRYCLYREKSYYVLYGLRKHPVYKRCRLSLHWSQGSTASISPVSVLLVSNPDPNLRVSTIVQPILCGCTIVVTRRLGSGFETSVLHWQ